MPRKQVAHSLKQSTTSSSASVFVPEPRGYRIRPKAACADLAKIYIAKRDLKLTDELYRGFMNVLFGETSAKDLTHGQVEELLQHFKSLGWQSNFTPGQESEAVTSSGKSGKPKSKTSSGRGSATAAQISLIVYLWKHGPGIRHKSMEALDHFLNHHFQVSQLKNIKIHQVQGILGAIKNIGKI